MNINRKIRSHALAEYGFLEYKVLSEIDSCTGTSSAHSYIIHPEIDMLFLKNNSTIASSPINPNSELILHRIRNLAVDTFAVLDRNSYFWKIFSQMKSLELIYVVHDWSIDRASRNSSSIIFYDEGFIKSFKLLWLAKEYEILDMARMTGSDLVRRPAEVIKGWRAVHGHEKPSPQMVVVREFFDRI